MCQGIIYRATNLINGKTYIGQTTKTLNERKRGHKNLPRKNNDIRTFQYALNKYGMENFKWEIIYECEDVLLDMMETFKIMVNHSHYTENGYNLNWGGKSSPLGYKHTEEAKKKISNVHKGRKLTEEHKRKLSEIGKTRIVTDVTRKKISISSKGRKHSKETKEKMKGRVPSNKGKCKYSDSINIDKITEMKKMGISYRVMSKILNIPSSTLKYLYKKYLEI